MKNHLLTLKFSFNLSLLLLLVLLILIGGGIFYQQTWGLKAHYYPNIQWEGDPISIQTDSTPYLLGDTGFHLTSTHTYSVKWDGWIRINRPGTYRFVTNSDDGSHLWLNKTLLIDNGGLHGLRRVSTNIFLEKGIYPINISYLQVGGYSVLQTRWAPPGSVETQIPAEVLFQKRPTRFDVFLRQSVIIFRDTLKTNWIIFLLGICLAVIVFLLPYRQILTSLKPFHRILLCSAGFFLFGIFLIHHGSEYTPIAGDHIPTWHLQANSNTEETKFAIDRWDDTAWATAQPMHSNMFLKVNLGQPSKIGKIVLSHGKFFENYPRDFRIEVSMDAIHWKKLHIPETRLTSQSIELFITSTTFQYITFFQTGQSSAHWVIQELSLYSPAWIPRPYQYPLLFIFLAGFFGITLYFGVSIWRPSQSCGKLLLCGLTLIIIIGFGLRIFMIQYHDLQVDEKQYLFESLSYLNSDAAWAKHTLNTDHRRTAILYLYLTRVLFRISHISSLSIRLMSVLLGTFTIPLTFYVWRKLSAHQEKCFEAFIASAFIAVNILHVCWSRDGHSQIQMTFFYILYIYVTSKTLRPLSHPQLLFWETGIVLFLGFFFHGSMLIAPVGIVMFMILDGLMTRWHVSNWRPIIIRNYRSLLLGSLPFWAYVYYILSIKGGFVDAEKYAHTGVQRKVATISYIMDFLQTRWHLLARNLNNHELLVDYDFLSLWLFPVWGLLLTGLLNILYRRQKTEWFAVFQPLFFCVILSSLWSASSFERFLLPVLLTASVCVARGVVVVSGIFKKPVRISLTRVLVSIFLVLSLSGITCYHIFWKQPPYARKRSWVYRVYSGKHHSFMSLVKYTKQNSHKANSIVMCTDQWIAPHYPNMFNIPINFLEPMHLKDLINKEQDVPVFIVLTPTADPALRTAIEQQYHLIGTRGFDWQLYELEEKKRS